MTDKKITIWTTKGGCGKTNISAELALQLSYPVMSSDNYNYRSPTIIITEFGHKKITLFYIYFPLCFC